ncbi:MAG: YoaK family protein [Bacteriovoracia bacterium]
MYRLEREQFLETPRVALWALIAFQAGFINAFGFLACGRYVSHVTGFGTQIGVAIAEKKLFFAIELLGFPLTFILGAFVSGFITSARVERGLRPRYDYVILTFPIILFALLIFGQFGFFGVFGEQLVEFRDFALLFSLTFFCGMQNGCFATMTKGQIRTTHLTGLSTDIGTDFARLFFGNLSESEYALTRKTNFSRISTFLGFASGSVISVIVSSRLGYHSLVVPLITSLFIYGAVRRISANLDRLRQIELRNKAYAKAV